MTFDPTSLEVTLVILPMHHNVSKSHGYTKYADTKTLFSCSTPSPRINYFYDKAVLEPWVSLAFAITYFYNHCYIRFDPIPKLKPKVIDLLMTFDPKSVEVMCVTLPKDHRVQVRWKYIKVCGYSDFKKKKSWTKGHWPLDDLWPQVCWGHVCDTTQGSSCPSPMKIHKSMWIQWL